MTRKGSGKKVGPDFVQGRRANGRAYLQAAQDALALAGDDTNANPAMSHIVNAAIAFADALTALKKSEKNQKDHQGLIKALRDAFGNELPKAQENHLGKILGIKDEVQYGARLGKIDQAKILLGHLERFAQWAEQQFP